MNINLKSELTNDITGESFKIYNFVQQNKPIFLQQIQLWV